MDTRARTRAAAGTKRNTLAAQLEEDPALSSSRRSQRAAQHESSMSKNTWEQRLLLAQDRIAQLEAQIVERDAAHARVRAENAKVVEREKQAREARLALECKVQKIKEETETSKATLMAKVRDLTETNAEFQDEYESLKETIESLKSGNALLERKLSTTEAELKAAQTRQTLAVSLRAQLDDALAEIDSLKASGVDSTGTGRDKEWAIVKEELARQTAHVTQLTRHNAQLTRQLQDHHNSELVREENHGLKARVADLTAEVQRMARIESELRAAVANPKSSRIEKEDQSESLEISKLRVENATLLDQIGELRGKRDEQKEVDEGDDSEAVIAELEAETERLRGMVAALQVKVRVGSEERKVLRGILSSTYPDPDSALSARVEQLEQILEQRESENSLDVGDMSMQSQIGDVTFSTVRWEAVREREKREEVEQEVVQLTTQLEAHEQTIDALEQALFELKGEVAAGTHPRPGTRLLQLADNPEARWFETREEQMGRLRDEVTALRNQVGSIPDETFVNLQKEKSELEDVIKQKEKWVSRLTSVYKSRAGEFRESVSSLLGYKLHFSRDVRLTSVFDQTVDVKFTQSGRNRASVWPIQIVGDQSKEDVVAHMQELKSHWIDQKENIPCFLAQLTLYAYERAEMGLSDWVGLDG